MAFAFLYRGAVLYRWRDGTLACYYAPLCSHKTCLKNGLSWLVFGLEPPKVSLKTLPNGSVHIQPINDSDYVVTYETDKQIIWRDFLLHPKWYRPIRLARSIEEREAIEHECFNQLANRLADLTGSDKERKLFDM